MVIVAAEIESAKVIKNVYYLFIVSVSTKITDLVKMIFSTENVSPTSSLFIQLELLKMNLYSSSIIIILNHHFYSIEFIDFTGIIYLGD